MDENNKLVLEVIESILVNVDEIVNTDVYFSIYYIFTSEINYIIDLNPISNVEHFNKLHVEKLKREKDYTIIFVRKPKQPELENWLKISINDKQYLINKIIINEIKLQIDNSICNQEICKVYIKYNGNYNIILNDIIYSYNNVNFLKK